MWCLQCKKIIPITANNFFITLNLPQQFELDLQRLESNFFAQLRQTHPDKFINQEKSAISPVQNLRNPSLRAGMIAWIGNKTSVAPGK